MAQFISVLNSLKEKLETVSPRTAEWEAKVILRHVTGKSWAELYAGDGALSEDDERVINEFAAQRAEGDPLAYVLGTAPFKEKELRVGPGVLIPRIETELLVQEAVDTARKEWAKADPILAVDLGTGTGCIALALAEAEPRVRVDAVEFSTEALRFARLNVAASPASDRVRIVPLDYLKESWTKLQPTYHLILANPPYVSQEDWDALPKEVKAEPHRALVAGPKGDEVLRWIIEHGRKHLLPGGKMILEVGIGQAEGLARFAETFPELRCDKIIPDHQNIGRILAVKKL